MLFSTSAFDHRFTQTTKCSRPHNLASWEELDLCWKWRTIFHLIWISYGRMMNQIGCSFVRYEITTQKYVSVYIQLTLIFHILCLIMRNQRWIGFYKVNITRRAVTTLVHASQAKYAPWWRKCWPLEKHDKWLNKICLNGTVINDEFSIFSSFFNHEHLYLHTAWRLL